MRTELSGHSMKRSAVSRMSDWRVLASASRALYAIDGKVWAEKAGISGTSDDGFLYARCYVVAQGRAFYEAVRCHLERFPKSLDCWCEGLLYEHRRAWAAGAERDASEWPFETSVSFETGSHQELWAG